MIIIIVLVAIVIVFVAIILWLRGRKIKVIEPYVLAYCGSLGSGKTYLGIQKSIQLYKKNFKKYLKEGKKRKEFSAPPLFYSNIPVQFKYKGQLIRSITNIKEVLLLNRKVPRGSILFIDEIGLLINKWHFKDDIVQNQLSECFRLWRQYTHGGYIVLTDQTIDDIIKPIRDRIGILFICLGVKKILKFGCFQFAPISFTQQLDTYKSDELNKLVMRQFTIFRNNYDSYAYSYLYDIKNFNDKSKNISSDSLKVKELINLLEKDKKK